MFNVAAEIENPMVSETIHYSGPYVLDSFHDEETCWCGKKAHTLVYEQKEPHCKECLVDALDCKVEIPWEVL